MRFPKSTSIGKLILALYASVAAAFPAYSQYHIVDGSQEGTVLENHGVSIKLFSELEEFSRLVDIAYCVGGTGIRVPFKCESRCHEFPGYQLVDTWNTGPLMSDSCGYIALDHHGKRVIVVFRGTYSITNTIMDLATIPQEYVPYPDDSDDDTKKPPCPEDSSGSHDLLSGPWRWFKKAKQLFGSWTLEDGDLGCAGLRKQPIFEYGHDDTIERRPDGPKCRNCTVHIGFFLSWKDSRRIIIPHLKRLRDSHPTYSLHLVGHSLGGAVAALAGLEAEVLGWHPTITTFGEPRIGNVGLRDYLNELFKLDNCGSEEKNGGRYRRITHANDPVPLLPLTEWGYRMHSSEIYITRPNLQPSVSDLRLCDGDEDPECIFSGEAEAIFMGAPASQLSDSGEAQGMQERELEISGHWGFPARYRMWQLFLAHRDYFWRLGVCIPGGDPVNWGRRYEIR